MNHMKAGFMLAVGWYLGREIVDALEDISGDLVRRYVPEKYWNPQHPDSPLNRAKKYPEAKQKIGFAID